MLTSAYLQVLAYSSDGTVGTGDHPTSIVLGRMPEEVIEAVGHKLRPGILLRFMLGEGGVHVGLDGMPMGADIEWVGVVNMRRGATAHTFSRIVSQWQMRTDGISFAALLARVEMNNHVSADACTQLQICDDGMDLEEDSL